ncbi:lysine transporter LysE [Photobacterium kishitanii]|uniref:LysE family translocator n=1 Tax=Photobacterium kishitanii TaxID=318456 RepID=A0A2T3KAF1_9GAMM|nr:LysE family translocator [Photobacterium kishitanii]KJG06037.1 lysine transporter LysE [Photobacterium kishitanii]KJG55092.1 lysine transporter LysE [Photobacterium kishitanii]KJG57116.1 lysine transporter LysE [Photobacterium kishitanii]KJG64121.1 lysine transporter LysE [Photobacterium kishitanii]KJG65654.1 lysine transporter LysE [Photobacterium kishitanii]
MTISIWLSLLVICLLGAMSPGPSLAVVAKHSLSGGRWHGIVTAWAHACGVGFYALLTLVGLAAILHQSPLLFTSVSYVGAGYLAYLGINALRSKGGVAAKLAQGQASTLLEAARDGVMISLFNPKLALFFLALFSQFVAVGNEISSKIIIVATPLLVDGLWYTLIACVLSYPAVLTLLRTKAQIIDRLSGIVLLGLAFRVVWLA